MSSKSQCSKESCTRPSEGACYSCKKKFCREHLKQHEDSMNADLDRLAKEMKSVSNRYTLIDPQQLVNECGQRLDKWRNDCYEQINRVYEEKCEELLQDWSQRVNKPRKHIDVMESKLNEIVRKKKPTHEEIQQVTETIRYIDLQIKDIDQKGIQMAMPSFVIDKNSKPSKESNIEEVGGFQLESSYKSVDCSTRSGAAIAANAKTILVNEYEYLNLFDQELILVQQIPWKNGQIYDMIWSTQLNNFIIITDRRIVYRLNESPLSCTPAPSIPQEKWWSCTCSDKFLYMSTYGIDPCIFQFYLSPKFEHIKQWRVPDTCQQYESIHDINYANETLGLMISNSSDKITRLEVRSSTTLNPIWSLTLKMDQISYQPSMHCCRIKNSEWIVVMENIPHIFHISKDGTLKKTIAYKPTPWNALLCASNILAIRTENYLFLHNI